MSQVEIDLSSVEDHKTSAHVITKEELEKIGNFCVYDEAGNRYQMGNIWADFKTVFVFVRVY